MSHLPTPLPQARTYVLELSMDASIDQALPTRRCEGCGAATWEANLACHACRRAAPPCPASGYPVTPDQRVAAPGGGARRDDWNAWVGKFGTDPATGAPASQLY